MARERRRRDVREAEPLAPVGRDRCVPGVDRGGRAGRDRGRKRGVPGLVGAPRRRTRGLLHKGGSSDRGARRAGRPGHDRGDGQAAPRGSPGDASRRDHPPLRRRRGLAADRRAVRAVGRRPAPVHPAPPARCRRAHHSLELPDRDPGVEARARTDLRQHARPEARIRGAPDRSARGRVLRRGGATRRRPQRPHRRRLEGRRGDRLQRRRPGDLVHGLRCRRPLGARRSDRARLPRPARARRAQPADRDRRRQSSIVPSRPRTPAPSGRPDRSARRPGGSWSRTRSTTRSATSCSLASQPARSEIRRIPRSRSAPS